MVIARKYELITVTNVSKILICCGNQLWIRTPLTWQVKSGVYKLCYGIELSSGDMAQYGDSVGILTTQSIDEPRTQFSLRTFHWLNSSGKMRE